MKVATLLAISTLVPSFSAAAVIVTYNDRATFLAAAAASAATAFPNFGNVASPFVNGSLTYSLGPGATQLVSGTGDGTQWSTLFAGHELALSGVEDLDVAAAGMIFSFGFDFHEPGTSTGTTDGCALACVDSTFSVTLFNGLVNVGSFNFNAPNDTVAFFGAWSDTAFNRVEIREIAGSNDNEFYAQFYTGTTPLSQSTIPEPATVALLAGGLGLLLALRARH